MPESVTVWVNGTKTTVPKGAIVSTALLAAGQPCRISVSGEPRGPVCGMGICFECRAIVDGVAYARTCQLFCHDGMHVETQR